MDNVNLDPAVGEEVRWGYQPGVFRVVRVRLPGDEHPNPNLRTPLSGLGTVDLQREGSHFIHESVPWGVLQYVDETRPIRRAIEWLRENPVVPFPDYFLDYQVEAKNDHQGNPAFYVRFFVEPDDQPSPEKIDEINRFLGSVQTMLLSLGLDRWPYVQVSEKRSLLDVAS
jgi:hypothetical protein